MKILLLALLLAVSGCDVIQFPVSHEICNINDGSCFVSAKFKNIESCNIHNRFSSSLCNRVSYPGEIRCDTTHVSAMVTSRCRQ